jgi:hypothetical protein
VSPLAVSVGVTGTVAVPETLMGSGRVTSQPPNVAAPCAMDFTLGTLELNGEK